MATAPLTARTRPGRKRRRHAPMWHPMHPHGHTFHLGTTGTRKDHGEAGMMAPMTYEA